MKKVKSVSFNDNLPEEKAMLRYFSRRNFSKYVKGLIKEDMRKKVAEKPVKAQNVNGTLKINF